MRPHQLSIEAFGPFAQLVEIGFDELGQEGLFLIHGPTGAGKTFLLDALCFALYGEVSGERGVKSLKSDHAAPTAVPRVILTFSSSGARYRVERSPAHTAVKTRGEGTTEKAAQAVLFRVDGAEQQAIARRATEVTREVERLVGLNAGQFRQVILLPQGRFAEVLRAKADEREALLKTLFDTVVFEQVGIWLENRARTALAAVEDQNRAQLLLRYQAAREWSPYAGDLEEEVPADQLALDRLLGQITAVAAGTESSLDQTTAALTAAQQARAELDRLTERWDRRDSSRTRLAALEAEREPVEALRLQLATARQAENLRISVESERSARAALSAVQASIRQQLQQATRARDAAQALPVSVVLLDLANLPGLDDLSEASSELAARRVGVNELVKKARQAAEARTRATEAARLLFGANAEHSRCIAAQATKQEEKQAAVDGSTRARSARDQVDGLQRAARETQDRAEAVNALPQARAREHEAIAAKTDADARVAGANQVLVTLRQRQIDGMAARLAGELSSGVPCPVCGSQEHPVPALLSQDAVSEEQLNAAEAALTQATRAAESAAVAVAEARGACEALLAKAGDAFKDPEAARQLALRSAEALEEAQALAMTLDDLEQTISRYDRELKQLETALQAASTQIALQAQTEADESKRAESLAVELVRELGEGIEPEAVLKSLTPLEEALKALAGTCEANISATTRFEQTSARLAQDLEGSPFADASAVKEALQDVSVQRRWETRIQRFETEVTEQKGILASADLAHLPEERPDTAAAIAVEKAADAARTAAVERHTQARRALVDIQRFAHEHREGEASLVKIRAEAQLLSAVADRCQGKTSPFISMQRWVLSAYLAEICRYANQRLELMTSGRYQLRLTDEGGRGGRKAGLGLRVLDAYTGEEREVSSLSGGETFQASLALALGVADTVQAHAGGVQLDALFIDEGFGTLDPDNLQLAMDELDRLREGGRMIGLISHVGALRERIRCGIQVVASDQGSTVRLGRPSKS